jgi:predicted Zn-dependent peptidase
VSQEIHVHTLPNGLVLLGEPMPWLESAAFALLLPAGCSRDPEGRGGLANLVCEMAQRGSGERDSRRFIEDLENLGVDRSASVGVTHASYGGAMPFDKLDAALAIYADLVRDAHLPEDQLEDSKQSCAQEIRALEDDLPQRAMIELRKRHYGDPLGRSSLGTLESLESIEASDVAAAYRLGYRPDRAILSVAGKIDWPALCDRVEALFGNWQSVADVKLPESPAEAGYVHLLHPSSQTQITFAYRGVAYSDPDYFQARGAIGVLSDGMSSRLFTEVREKRGLVYTVFASLSPLKDRGGIHCYAGTSTERAQETLDVMIAELLKLSEGITPDELRRLKARLKSSLIFQQESSYSRSGAIAADWYYLGRTQTLDELQAIVDRLTCESINRWLAEHPPTAFTLVTLGEQPLVAPQAMGIDGVTVVEPNDEAADDE